MTLSVVLRPQARQEFAAATDWYEAQAPGLGRRFTLAIDHCLARIAEDPLQFPLARRNARRLVVRRFPYAIYFQHEPALHRVVVIAIFHGSRDPRTWQQRH